METGPRFWLRVVAGVLVLVLGRRCSTRRARRAGGSDDDQRKTAYQTSVQLMVYEGTVLWARMNTMIVLNALLIAASTFLVQSEVSDLAHLPPLLGAVLSLTLLAVMYRGQDFHRYWELTAARLEADLTARTARVVTRNIRLRQGETQSMPVAGRTESVRLHLRRFRARQALLLVTALLVTADLFLSWTVLTAAAEGRAP